MKHLTLASALFALALPTTAQLCLGPDQLDMAPCCTPVDLAIPALPSISMKAQGICWDSCSLAAQNCVEINTAPPTGGPNCGEFTMPMEVIDCSGVTLLQGTAILNYTRTWEEHLFPGGPFSQVYRFTFKADLAGNFAATPFCPVPPSLGAYPTSFWYGYVDWSFDCIAGTWQNAMAIYHGADAFTHHPLLSSQPGTFNPTRTYAIAGPDTAANPFFPSVTPPVNGPIVSEAIRSTASPIPFACLAEEPIQQGQFQHLISLCMNPITFGLGMQHLGRLIATGVCGSSFSTLNAFPTAPWYELVTTSIGRWSTGANYPGPESAAVAEGLFLYTEGCGGPVPVSSLDVFYGGITQGGYFMVPTNPIGGQTQVDLASNYSNPFPGPIALPAIGNVMQTDHLIYLTLP